MKRPHLAVIAASPGGRETQAMAERVTEWKACPVLLTSAAAVNSIALPSHLQTGGLATWVITRLLARLGYGDDLIGRVGARNRARAKAARGRSKSPRRDSFRTPAAGQERRLGNDDRDLNWRRGDGEVDSIGDKLKRRAGLAAARNP